MTTNLILSPCDWCDGWGDYDHLDRGRIKCPVCDGGRFNPLAFALSPTRTHQVRECLYNPGTGDLAITQDKKKQGYKFCEFPIDQSPNRELKARAFAVNKLNKYGKIESTYHVLIGEPGLHTCDCPGFSYEAVAKGNKRAWTTGEPMCTSHGCVHLDTILELYFSNLFDTQELLAQLNSRKRF